MKRIGLIANPEKDEKFIYTKKVIHLLEQAGFEVLISQKIDELPEHAVLDKECFFEKIDAIITLGGDGTVLDIADMAARHNKPVLAINLGHLGYLSQLEKDDLHKIPEILSANTEIEHRFMLTADLILNDGKQECYHALNDIVLGRESVCNMVHTQLFSNDEFVYRFKGDGLIFSTPTGSTAYSMSSGGPIADCNLKDIIIVTPVCEHSLFSKSMIFSADDILSCSAVGQNAHLVIDGKPIVSMKHVFRLNITRSKYSLPLFKLEKQRFYKVLNDKFSDGGSK